MKAKENFQNHFLVATPSMLSDESDIFHRSVVFLFDHSKDGAMGVVINKPLPINLTSVLDHLKIECDTDELDSHAVLMGGPMKTENGFILHTDELAKEGVPLDELNLSTSKETLQDIAKGDGPDDFLVALGCAGWDRGQLEEEIAENDWIVVPFSREILYDVPFEMRWFEAAKLAGIDLTRMTEKMGHA